MGGRAGGRGWRWRWGWEWEGGVLLLLRELWDGGAWGLELSLGGGLLLLMSSMGVVWGRTA